MQNFNKLFLFTAICIGLTILASCQYTSQLGSTPQNQLSPMSVATLQAYATPLTVFEYPDRVTDGKLLFSIELANNKCYKIIESIEIKIIFENLTDSELTIPADFAFAINRKGMGGNLIPFITTEQGKDILSPADYQLLDIFSTPSNVYKNIQANQKISFDANFIFPQDIVVSETTETYNLGTPNPGQYFIRLIYSEFKRNNIAWYGVIGSNRIEICILD